MIDGIIGMIICINKNIRFMKEIKICRVCARVDNYTLGHKEITFKLITN